MGINEGDTISARLTHKLLKHTTRKMFKSSIPCRTALLGTTTDLKMYAWGKIHTRHSTSQIYKLHYTFPNYTTSRQTLENLKTECTVILRSDPHLPPKNNNLDSISPTDGIGSLPPSKNNWYTHVFWCCPILCLFWKTIDNRIHKITGTELGQGPNYLLPAPKYLA